MKYTIVNTILDKVKSVGSTDAKEVPGSKIILATLTQDQVYQLKKMGAIVYQTKTI